MLVYKHGSTHASLDGYACPELSWLGLVASDVLEPLPRSLFSGNRADAERMLPPMWKTRPVWPAAACMLCMAGRAGRRISRGLWAAVFDTGCLPRTSSLSRRATAPYSMGCGSGAPCVRTVRAPPLAIPSNRSAEVAHSVPRLFAPLPVHVGVAATLAHEVEQMHEAQLKVE